jgi:signal peptidase
MIPKKYIKTISGIFYWLFFTVLLFLAGFLLICGFLEKKNFRLLVVQSGSMEPTIQRLAIVGVKKTTKLEIGDIITFVEADSTRLVTHRLVEYQEKEGREIFITKGDANDDADSYLPTKDQIIGKVVVNIPYLGYLVNFSRSQNGLILMVILPATLIIVSELLNIKKEINKLLLKK